MAQRGPPSLYTEEIAQRIIDGLMDGLSLIKICEQDGIPSRRTVFILVGRKPGFLRKVCGIRCNADSDSTARGTAIR